jgi:hypothetical protein
MRAQLSLSLGHPVVRLFLFGSSLCLCRELADAIRETHLAAVFLRSALRAVDCQIHRSFSTDSPRSGTTATWENGMKPSRVRWLRNRLPCSMADLALVPLPLRKHHRIATKRRGLEEGIGLIQQIDEAVSLWCSSPVPRSQCPLQAANPRPTDAANPHPCIPDFLARDSSCTVANGSRYQRPVPNEREKSIEFITTFTTYCPDFVQSLTTGSCTIGCVLKPSRCHPSNHNFAILLIGYYVVPVQCNEQSLCFSINTSLADNFQ